MAYQPREGSKTAAAAEYLRANGGQATAVQLSDAIDTAQKQFTGLFGPAIEHGFLAEIMIDGKRGYRLCDMSPPPPSWLQPPAIVPGEAPAQVEKPEPKKKTVRQMARSLKIESFADATPASLPPPRGHRTAARQAVPRRAVLGRNAAPGGHRGRSLHGAVRGHRLHRRNAVQGSRRQAGGLPGHALRS